MNIRLSESLCSSKQYLRIIFYFLCFSVIHTTDSFATSHIRSPRQATVDTCLLPPHPDFGQWSMYKSDSSFTPGSPAPSGAVLLVSCQNGYILDGDVSMVCINGRWTTEIGHCLKTCPVLLSKATMQVTCINANKKEINCTKAIDGTIAELKCADFYENSRHLAYTRDHVTCQDGKWSDDIPECVPVCGQKIVKHGPTLIVNGSVAKEDTYPWQVALYNVSDKTLLCGGSLLNQRVIVTAAHCVTDDIGKPMPKDMYMVAVGKYYRDFHDSRDVHKMQFSTLHDIYVPKQYRADIQNYLGDIAIIVTVKTFAYSFWVQPVCVDWESKYQNALLNPTKEQKFGYVSGWGYVSENFGPSDVLKELKVPLVSDEECLRNLPEDNEEYLTYDKLCAGLLNSSSSVCKGDSGGGLVFPYKRRYYLVAIVSISPQDFSKPKFGCNSQQYTLYTKISNYIEDFILQKEARIRAQIACEQDPHCKQLSPVTPQPSSATEQRLNSQSRTSCILPQHPNSGQWSIVGGDSVLKPGTLVQTSTVLQISCSTGHKLVGEELILCLNGNWSSQIGKCAETCLPLYSSTTIKVTCSYDNQDIENCTEAVDGTVAKFKCAPFYEFRSVNRNPVHLCIDGKWDQEKPTCFPICGQRKADPIELIINGKTAAKGSSPWQVAIYRDDNKMLICSGSLINPRVILTAANCIADSNGKLYPKEYYTVAAGKYYRKFNDSRDIKEAQISSVHTMFVPTTYKGGAKKYKANIGIIVAKESFTLSSRVLPVCYSEKYKPAPNDYGYVVGWGFTKESEDPSDVLKELKVPLIPSEQCKNQLPEGYDVFVTNDKLCAGYLNGTSVCKGDTGGGLVFRHDERYYISGILSFSPASPTSDGCDSNQYALYTNVNDYIENFISMKDAVFRPLN